jgi:hypothetical protein
VRNENSLLHQQVTELTTQVDTMIDERDKMQITDDMQNTELQRLQS